ncbi:MAG: alpha/beta fold hydrolase [Acidobacteriota bacterium]
MNTTKRLLTAAGLAILVGTAGVQAGQCVPEDPATCQTTECGSVPPPCPNGTLPAESTRAHVIYQLKNNLSACLADGGCADPRASCELNTATHHKQCNLRLEGDLYTPSGAGPFPAVLLNHGSSKCGDSNPACPHTPESFATVKSTLLAAGYVVFEPNRRGYQPSTGLYIDDLVARQIHDGLPCALGTTVPFQVCSTADLVDEAKRDVRAAFNYLAARPKVNPAKIAVMGHSLGGIVTVEYNSLFSEHKAAVTIAPGSESWCGNCALQESLIGASQNAKAPLFLAEPHNDVDRDPVIELGFGAGVTGHQYQSTIFPNVIEGGVVLTCGADAHVCFARDPKYVSSWMVGVLDFLKRCGVK